MKRVTIDINGFDIIFWISIETDLFYDIIKSSRGYDDEYRITVKTVANGGTRKKVAFFSTRDEAREFHNKIVAKIMKIEE